MGLSKIYVHQVRVYAEDVDYMGIVYHANYLCYFERARTELLREKQLVLTDLLKLDILFAIKEIHIKYQFPARMDDLLTITTKINEIKACSIIFEQKIVNHHHKQVSEAIIQVVCVNSQLKPKRLPGLMFKDLDIGEKK